MSLVGDLRSFVVETLNDIEALGLAGLTVLDEDAADYAEQAERQCNHPGLFVAVYVEEQSVPFNSTAQVQVIARENIPQNRGAGGTQVSAREWLADTILPTLLLLAPDGDLETDLGSGWHFEPAYQLAMDEATVDVLSYRLTMTAHTVPMATV